MHTDVYKYVQSCIACARNTPPNTRYLTKVLDTPLPFQSISLDFVGPRTYQQTKCWYAVIIDQCTRYLVTHTLMRAPNQRDVVPILHLRWITIFGAPDSITLDNDPIYTIQVRRYITEQLGTKIIQSSPGYPQGNGLNETSHKVLEKSIAIQVQRGVDIPFEDLVAEAAFAHNITFNVNLGTSPYQRLYGMEAQMPHHQQLTNLHITEQARQQLQLEGRIRQALLWNMRHEERMILATCNNIKKGDTVVYHRNVYEQRFNSDKNRHEQYTSDWSTPQLVLQVQEGSVTVRDLYLPRSQPRTVPMRLCRRLTSLKEGVQTASLDPTQINLTEDPSSTIPDQEALGSGDKLSTEPLSLEEYLFGEKKRKSVSMEAADGSKT